MSDGEDDKDAFRTVNGDKKMDEPKISEVIGIMEDEQDEKTNEETPTEEMHDGVELQPSDAPQSLPDGVCRDEKIAKDVNEIFEKGTWKGMETPMFEAHLEKEGYRLIYEGLSTEEKQNLEDDNMPLRYFRAEKGDIEKALAKIKSTIQWRKDVGVELMKTCFQDDGDTELRQTLERENETGKIYVRGYDKQGRAVLYFRPRYENTKDPDGNMKHLIYNIERAIACTKRKSGRSKYVVILDMEKYSRQNAPALSTSKTTLDILQSHYPERAFRFYICNAPMLFRVFWKVIRPFIDPVTKDKICFCYGSAGLKVFSDDFDVETTENVLRENNELRAFNSKEYLYGLFNYTFDEKLQ